MLESVEWGEYRLGDLFDIENTFSFNKESLTSGNDYDYVTRTSQNQGILQSTGFVNNENINDAGTWSLGLLQMDFFYRRKRWYAGQFVRKIVPKISLTDSSISFFSTILNKQKQVLLSVLVRDVDEVFRNITCLLPTREGEIDYEFMEKFIAELNAVRLAELNAYLSITGLKDYTLTPEEEQAVKDFETGNVEWREFDITKVFEVRNAGNILASEIVEGSGDIPYLCASRENNAVSSYISYREELITEGNCIFIGGKTFVVTYQERDFFSNDSHNLTLRLYATEHQTKSKQLYLATCVNKSLRHKYSWGDSVSKQKIRKDKIYLPSINEEVDFSKMETLISAVQKLVIKDVVLYADREIEATKQVINKER
ncbi:MULTISPECIES: restriction endonuclease subunit S [Porphyromonas]|uniref:restriction endonuclease subunit S n=1 Tax=Porphyromonas TaxID=836 RepID=UPI001FCA7929|nr:MULTISPECIES: restriction endonuclease subunit S [Porphyromonas]BDE82044.1 hypothetical protein CE91St14_10720 [Porphyromonas somerae]